jgi:Thioredoxin domain
MGLDVRVLYTEGCANTPQTVQRIRDVAQRMGIQIEVRQVQVTSQDQADECRFLGSPTVQIDGQDIDPAARTANAFGFT